MITIENKMLEDKLKNILKGIEILGGKEDINNVASPNELIVSIVNSALKGEEATIKINNKDFAISNIVKSKVEFEKHFIKNKAKVIKYMVMSITKHNSEVVSLLKKYRKDANIETFKEIEKRIIKTYGEDINRLILVNCDVDYSNNVDGSKYYGEYLLSKREELLYAIISKL